MISVGLMLLQGCLLELLLSKVLHCGRGRVQIVGMSATTGPSLAELAQWLHASTYERNFRPVELQECVSHFFLPPPQTVSRALIAKRFVLMGDSVLDRSFTEVRRLSKDPNDPSHLAALTLEVSAY
jgi:hypothetical protein